MFHATSRIIGTSSDGNWHIYVQFVSLGGVFSLPVLVDNTQMLQNENKNEIKHEKEHKIELRHCLPQRRENTDCNRWKIPRRTHSEYRTLQLHKQGSMIQSAVNQTLRISNHILHNINILCTDYIHILHMYCIYNMYMLYMNYIFITYIVYIHYIYIYIYMLYIDYICITCIYCIWTTYLCMWFWEFIVSNRIRYVQSFKQNMWLDIQSGV